MVFVVLTYTVIAAAIIIFATSYLLSHQGNGPSRVELYQTLCSCASIVITINPHFISLIRT